MIKKTLAIILCLSLIFSISGCGKKDKQNQEEAKTVAEAPKKEEPKEFYNPLTGEAGYKEKNLKKRPISVVVENSPEARPQWGIDSPDIIVEGEVEGGITRMLWLYANEYRLPDQIGPTRSARPSFVKFSQFFDSVFIHWGGSHSNSGYTGGYETIAAEGVDDLDGMAGGALFSRDHSRDVSSEHTGVVIGKELPKVLKSSGIRSEVDQDSLTMLPFRKKASDSFGTKVAQSVDVKLSSYTNTRSFAYDSSDKKYHTSDWDTDVSFENILILMSDTTYITVPYKGATTTYLNYSLDGGTAYYASKGKLVKIKWENDNGKISLSRTNGNSIKLNPGNTYIGLASENYSGSVDYSEN